MHVYRFGPFTLDAQQLLLEHEGTPLALGPKVVETLLALIEAPGEVCAKGALLDRIWPEGYVEEANLAQNIYVLRKTLKAHWDAEAIETIPRRGYRFTAAVTVVERAAAVPDQEPAVRVRTWPRYAFSAAVALIAVLVLTGFGIAGRLTQSTTPAQLSANGSRMYAIGRYYWNSRTRDGVTKSVAYFERVVDSDPHDPHGYAALAQANATMADYEFGPLKPAVYQARAREYANRALALDPASSDAYAALGQIAINDERFEEAKTQLEHAVALDPSNGPAHEWLGTVYLERGDATRAFAELKKSADLDPLNVATTAWLGESAYLNHHFEEAISYAQQTIDLSPKRQDAYAVMGLAYEAQGDYDDAVKSFTTYKSVGGCAPEGAALLAHVYARMGRIEEARRELHTAIAHPEHVSAEDMAVALIALGDRQRAQPYIAKARKMHSWTAIAQDPRVQAIDTDAS